MSENPYKCDLHPTHEVWNCATCASHRGWKRCFDEEVAALQRQFEPSPCGVAGHRQMDCKPLGTEIYGECFTCLACQREQAVAAAMAEKCAEFVEAHAQAYPTLPDMLREFSPAGVLEAHDQAVRLEEALWWWKKSTGIHKLVECPCKYCQRLAALRATPQPTAVKETANE